MTDTKQKTDRDRFWQKHDTQGRVAMTFEAMFQQRDEETMTAALKMFAQRYFDEFTDATDLPSEFWNFVTICEGTYDGIGLDLAEITDEVDG